MNLLVHSAPMLVLLFSITAAAQEGQNGVGHAQWHDDFYWRLLRNDTRTSCCSLADCRPTQSRMIGDHYEVKVDGAWTSVPKNSILDIQAPDGGAHVCASKQEGSDRNVIKCVVLPPET